MNDNFIKIGNKTIQLSQPYKAALSELIGKDNELRKILAAWMGENGRMPLSPLLLGEPGLGKNRIVYECAGICSKELYTFQGHEDVTAEDLICAVRFSDDPARKMDYILSPVATAMLKGAVCFIDEIGKIRPRALAPLASLLDERAYLDSNLLGERIHAHQGFRFIAATNTVDLESNMLPDFIRSRLRPVITVGFPAYEEIERMIRSRFHPMRNSGDALIEQFWKLWRDKNGERPPTPRDTIYLFGYALNLAHFETAEGRQPCVLETGSGSAEIEKKHLEKAFQVFYDATAGKL